MTSLQRSGETVSAEPWTIARVLTWATGDLGAKGSSSPRLDAELMLAQVLGCDRIKLILEAKQPLTKPELAAYRELHKRRRRGEPIAYLRGEREFYGRPFRVDPRVLIPRPETETLVECALRRSRHLSLCARVLDLCSGSGCVAITLKKERPTTTVFATDISTEALHVARDNDHRLGAGVAWLEADLFAGMDALAGRIDIVTVNPPYIDDEAWPEMARDIRDFEPRLALAAGEDALSVSRRIVTDARTILSKGGVLAIETMAGCGPALAALFREAGYSDIEVDRDFGKHERVVSGRLA